MGEVLIERSKGEVVRSEAIEEDSTAIVVYRYAFIIPRSYYIGRELCKTASAHLAWCKVVRQYRRRPRRVG